MTALYPYTVAQWAQVLAARGESLSHVERLEGGLHIAPVWRRVRAALFEPCETLERGYLWQDVA